MKLKTCSVCGQETFLWKSKPKTCKNCYQSSYSPIARSQKPIAKHSQKRQVEYRIYLTLRKIYLENHPDCKAQLTGCTGQSTEIHHRAGKIGELLTDIRYFLAVCRSCHQQIESEPNMAKDKGLSTTRIDK